MSEFLPEIEAIERAQALRDARRRAQSLARSARRWQFSLRALFAVMGFAAVACPALLHANRIWLSVAFSSMLVMLATAGLLAVFGRGARRASCVGFVAVAGGYMFLAFGPLLHEDREPVLVTTMLLNEVRPLIERPITRADRAKMTEFQYEYFEPSNNSVVIADALPMGHFFYRVGNCLFSLAFGLIGGFFASYLWTENCREKREPLSRSS
jgi:hypothetical protein